MPVCLIAYSNRDVVGFVVICKTLVLLVCAPTLVFPSSQEPGGPALARAGCFPTWLQIKAVSQ